jgi:aldose 1-epimerase
MSVEREVTPAMSMQHDSHTAAVRLAVVTAPTGEQFVIERPTPHGPARAVVTELAGGLRELSIGGVDLVESFPETASPPFAAGIVLVPWPNRVRDGVWSHAGVRQQLDLTEPGKHNAIHGLLRNTAYRLVGHEQASVTLSATVFPQHGYPFLLDTEVRYRLVDDGITVTNTVHNRSDVPAPVAIGSHPFLRIGEVPTEELILEAYADTHLELDDRAIPIGAHPVSGTEYDLRGGRRVGELRLDDAFADVRPVDGVSAVLRAPDGREVRLRQDAAHGYLQVFTPRTFPRATGPGLAIALEPMTAAPDALNSGAGLRMLEPGEAWSVGWGIQYRPGA